MEQRNVARRVRESLPTELQQTRPAGQYTLEQMFRIAQVFHDSGLFEDVKDAAQAMVKIMRGQEIGVPPTTAMQGMDIIAKRVYLKPWLIAAKINACGYGSYRVTDTSDVACTVLFRRKLPEAGWQDLEPIRYTIEEAQGHGLVQRSPHWKTSPANMLYMRAMGRGGVRYFPELFAGLDVPPETDPVSDEHQAANVRDLWGESAAPPPAFRSRLQQREEPVPTAPETPPVVLHPLPDDGWRTAVEAILGQLPLPQYATFVVEGQKTLTDPTTPLGRGKHLLYRCEQALDEVQEAQAAEETPQ